MKKSIVLFMSIVALALTFNSCSSDDGNGSGSGSTSGSILGKWIPLREVYGAPGEPEEVFPHEHLCSTTKDYLEVYDNGTWLGISYLTCSSEYQSTGTWSKNGNLLTISYVDKNDMPVTSTAQILELSASKLRFKSTDGDGFYTITEYVRE